MATQPPLQFGPYRLDGANGPLWRHTQLVKLPPKATAVLWCLVSQAGQVVTKDMLLDTVWAETAVSEGVLSICIRDLCRVLGDDPKQPHYIETVHRRGYRFLAPVAGQEASLPAPGAALVADTLAPPAAPGLVGRAAEVAQVQACLARAWGGQRQVLFVTGEAGIGKTTLVEACVQEVEAHGGSWVGWGQCVEAYGPGTGYLPVLEALGRLCREPGGPLVIDQLRQWAPTWLVQLSGVLEAAEQARLQRRTQGTTRARLLRELAEALEALTQTQLGVLVLEDLHWSDPSTVEVLTMLARRREAAQLMILGTYRPVELILRAHPLKPAVAELALHGHCTELALPYLAEAAVATYVAPRFPAPVAPMIYQRTAGHPLFMVHLVEYLVQQAGLNPSAEGDLAARVAAVAETVPAGVQQLIELQLGHLRAEEQDVLAMASVAAGLATALERPEAVCEALAQRGQCLEAGRLAVWPDGTVSGQYRFRHALYQKVLYRRLGSGRRVRYHRAIGTRLEGGYGAQAAQVAAELAMHFVRGRDPARAVPYLQHAAATALQRYAYREALAQLTTASEILATLPDTLERTRQELELQLALGQALFAIKGQGAPEVAQAYQRARALCQQVEETAPLGLGLVGLRMWYFARAELAVAHELSERLLHLTQHVPEPALLLEAHRSAGMTWLCEGELAVARMHLEHGIALAASDSPPAPLVGQRGSMPGMLPAVACHAYDSWALWQLGYADQAMRRGHEALALAQMLAHPFSMATAMNTQAALHLFRGEGQAALQQAEASLTLATKHELAHVAAVGMIRLGGALVGQGQAAAGIAQLSRGVEASRAIGWLIFLPYALALLAEAYGHISQPHAGLQVLAEAHAVVKQTGEHWWQAELHRLQGELLLQQGNPGLHQPAATAAAACLQQALDTARRQQARALELRAAMSLSRLWQQQGKRAAAYALLAPLYDWFTEGLETADLQEARALLEELS